ncbi:MAG: ATP-binding cassette domain-containing protein [Myxococcota bacterium]|nr:ATP-binding cassette domain-containing protein [Myxococcota bacterium]
MIEAIRLYAAHAGRVRLDYCSLSVRSGEVLGVVGAMGSGKSSLLAALAGQLPLTSGEIRLDGRKVVWTKQRQFEICSYLSEVVPGPLELTCQDWLCFWMDMAGLDRESQRTRLALLRDRFQLNWLNQKMTHCSRAQRRLLDLARVFSNDAKILLLDSPGHDLDGRGLYTLNRAIEQAQSLGKTIVISANTPHLVVAVCDRAVILQDGAVVADVRRGQDEFESMIARSQGWTE